MSAIGRWCQDVHFIQTGVLDDFPSSPYHILLPSLLSPLASYNTLHTPRLIIYPQGQRRRRRRRRLSSWAYSSICSILKSSVTMARKCSSCGNNGHNSRTCSGQRVLDHSISSSNSGSTTAAAATACGGLRLFGVQLQVGGGSSPLKKCLSMECLASPAYYGASASPSVSSSSSSLVSIEENTERVSNGYLSDGLMGRVQERKKGEPE
jgi:hypothetical protein